MKIAKETRVECVDPAVHLDCQTKTQREHSKGESNNRLTFTSMLPSILDNLAVDNVVNLGENIQFSEQRNPLISAYARVDRSLREVHKGL